MNKTTFSRAFLLLALILTCALQSRAEEISSTPSLWGYENGSVVSQVTVGDFTLIFSKGTGRNAPAYYTLDKTLRFYEGNIVAVISNNSMYEPTHFGYHEFSDETKEYMFDRTESFSSIKITYKVITEDFTYKGIEYTTLTESTCQTKAGSSDGSGNSVSGVVTIPETVYKNGKAYTVTALGDYAFSWCTKLTSVTIPNSVTSIGASAFHHCRGLTSVVIPNLVTSIGNYAFYDCISLTSVIIPNSVTSIGGSAFKGCTALTSVNISNSVQSIYLSTFEGCSALSSVTIPNSVTTIVRDAFSGCSGITELNIADSGTKLTIESDAFTDVKPAKAYLGRNISSAIFTGDTNLSKLTIGDKVTAINNAEFSGCSGITELNIADSGTKLTIGSDAFKGVNPSKGYLGRNISSRIFIGRSNLVEVTIGDKVTALNAYEFQGCSSLACIIIPNSVTSIGIDAFGKCTNLVKSAYPNSVSNPFDYGIAVSYPADDAVIEDGVIWNSDKTKLYFGYCNYQGEFTIPNSVTEIGDYALYGCNDLSKLVIPNSVTSIGRSAFQNCFGITELSIADSETKLAIGDGAFSKVKPRKAYLGRNISSAIFTNDTYLSELTIGDKVTAINSSEFNGCRALKKVNIFDIASWCGISFGDDYSNPLYFTHNLYLNDDEITELIIPESVTSIGNYAFYGGTNLTSVTIHGSVTTIGDYAFNGCTGLKWIDSQATTPPTIYSNTFSDYSALLIAASEDYKTTNYWQNFADILAEHTPTGRTFEENGLKYEIIDVNDYTCRLYGIDESVEGDVVIPATVTYRDREFTPIEISGILIKGETPITSLSIPSNISTISSGSLLNASLAKLTVNTAITNNITISSSIDELVIAPSVDKFSNDLNSNTIGKLTIEDGETALTTTQFKGAIKEVYLGRNVSESTFAGITSLEKVSISDKVTLIGQSTLSGCSGVNELNIADSETELTIGSDAFTDVKPIKAYLGRNISGAIFTDNTNLSDLTIGDKVTSINDSEFSGCTGLTSVTIPSSITSIGKDVFNNCTGLVSVTIPNSVTSIGSSAFYDCKGMTSVTIPNTVTSIGASAFKNCAKLTTVNIFDLAAWCGISFDNYYSNPLYYASHLYLNEQEVTDVIIPETVTSIGQYAFDNFKGITAVTIPNSVTSIGGSAFYKCTGLSAITVPNSVTKIGSSAFRNCSSVTDLYIADSESQLTIEDNAFYNVTPTKAYLGRNISRAIFTDNTNLLELTIGEQVTAVSSAEFSGCSGVTELNIADSESQLTIGSDAFSNVKPTKAYLGRNIRSAIFTGDTNLSDLTIGDKVTAINASEFSGCTALAALTIPNSVISIGSSSFNGCSVLTALTIPNSVALIGASAFSGCSTLTEVRFDDGESVLTLGDDAFSDAAPTKAYFGRQMNFANAPVSALETVEFGENVTSIETGAFKEAKSLLSVTSRNTVPPTTDDTFHNDTYLDGTLYVPATALETYKAAVGWKNFWEIKDLNDIITEVSEIGDNSNAPFSVENGAICVDGDADVRIVSMNGTTVYSGRGETRINLTPGVYIVIINNTPTKVAVK